jgi:hypothetical protein
MNILLHYVLALSFAYKCIWCLATHWMTNLFQKFPLLALFFGHMKDSLYSFWLGMKKVSDAFQSLERIKVIYTSVYCILWLNLCLCVMHVLMLRIWLRKAVVVLYMGNCWWYSGHVSCWGKESYFCSTLYKKLKQIAQIVTRECILRTDYYSDFSVNYY